MILLVLALLCLWVGLIVLAVWCFALHQEVGRLTNEVDRVRPIEVELRRLQRVNRC